MKAIIVEDEKLSAHRLNKLVTNLQSIEVLAICYSVKSAKNWLAKNETPDLLFLDIQLGDGTSFDVLDSLDSFPQVIFTTAFDQYILDAFKYNSIDYLLKPINPENLEKAIEKLKKVRKSGEDFSQVLNALKTQLKKDYKKKFLVKIGLKYQSIPTKDVAYFFSEESSTFIKT
ncbi:MAG: response regulator, partial [Bacteroidota bacterium]